jgi:hypothetical protein
MWLPTNRADYWLLVASAEWAAFRADGYPTLNVLNPADISLDCRDPLTPADYIDANTASNQCYLTPPSIDYIGNGDARWPFFEYLSETYGPSFVKDIFNMGHTGAPTALAAVDDALQAKGSSLISAYNAWQRTAVTSSWAIPALQVTKPVSYLPAVFTGAADTATLFPGGTPTATVPSVTVAANHLSTRFLKFQRGPAVGGSQSTTCWAATLTLTVSLPAGSSSQPVFYWDGPTPLVTPLSVNGNTATADVPWDTCTWISGEGFLSLPNASNDVGASLKVDAGDFVVSAKLKVNPAIQVTPITPVIPPNPVFVTGPVISVGSSDIAPSITVFGPQLLKLSKTDTQVRLIIGASGQGQVSAKLGTLALGKVSLRAGNNDVRFTIPKGTLGTLAVVRGSAGAPNVLTLTPTSADGTTTGAAVTRTISVGPDKPSVTKTLAAKTLAKKAAAKKAAAKKAAAKKAAAKKAAAKKTKHATK